LLAGHCLQRSHAALAQRPARQRRHLGAALYAHVWESTGFELPVAHDVALSGEAAAVAEARWPHYEQLRALRVIVGN